MSIPLGSLEDKVVETLKNHYGRNNPVTAKHIAYICNTNERTVRQTISNLRCEGHLIASTPNPPYGFYIPKSREEAEECSNHLWARVRNISRVARAFDNASSTLGYKRTKAQQIQLIFRDP